MAGKQFFFTDNNKESVEIDTTERDKQLEKERIEALKKKDERFTIDATSKYNKSLLEIDPILQNLVLPKGKVLIRLFQAPKVRASGIYVPDTSIIVSENTGKPKIEAMDRDDTKYFSRGVVVAVGPEVEENLAFGTVIDLYMMAYRNIMQYWSPLNRLGLDSASEPENYFTIPENQINFIWKNYQV